MGFSKPSSANKLQFSGTGENMRWRRRGSWRERWGDPAAISSIRRFAVAAGNDAPVRVEGGRILNNLLRQKDAPIPDKTHLEKQVAGVRGEARQALDTSRKATAHLLPRLFLALLIGALCKPGGDRRRAGNGITSPTTSDSVSQHLDVISLFPWRYHVNYLMRCSVSNEVQVLPIVVLAE
jgi:hypothetical protein